MVRRFTDRKSPKKGKNRFKIKHFDRSGRSPSLSGRENSRRLVFFLPYFLAISIQMIHSLFVRRGQREGDFVISATRDMRVKDSSKVSILFNHFSVIYFRVSALEIDDFQMLVGRLKRRAAIANRKNKTPRALSNRVCYSDHPPKSVLSYGFEFLLPTPMPTFVLFF